MAAVQHVPKIQDQYLLATIVHNVESIAFNALTSLAESATMSRADAMASLRAASIPASILSSSTI